MSMFCYQITEFGEPLERRDYEIPDLRGTEVLVKVAGCGVCHSDLHLWGGYLSLGGGKKILLGDRMPLPFTLGHEVSGTVAAVGPEVEGLTVGTRGIVYPWIGCGECVDCRRGRELQCLSPRTVGTRRNGGYGDHVVVPHPRYVVDYGALDPMFAATLACSGLTAYSAVKKLPPLCEEDLVVIIGAGGVGLAAIGLFASVCRARLVVGDIDAGRRAAAERAGASATFDPSAPDAADVLRSLHPRAPLGVIDFVGTEQTATLATGVLGRGGIAVFVGLYGGEIPVSVSSIAMQNIVIRGSYVGTLDEFRELVDLAKAGRFAAIPVRTRPMGEVNEILKDLADGRVVGRVVMSP